MEQKERLNPWAKNIRHAGSLWGNDVGGIFAGSYVLDETDDSDVEAGVIASAVGVTIGVLIAIGTLIYRRFEPEKAPSPPVSVPLLQVGEGSPLPSVPEQENAWWTDNLNDPWNARVKAGVVFGEGIGRTIFSILPPIPIIEKILIYVGGAIGGVLGGIIAYFTPASWWTKNPHRQTSNPVSERVRTGGMIGSFAGIALSLLFLITPGGALAPGVIVAVCGGLGALFGSVIALFVEDRSEAETSSLAPFEKGGSERSEAGDFKILNPPDAQTTCAGPLFQRGREHSVLESNPWSKRIRAGVQWGACLGILLAVLFPGFGLGLSLPVSVAIGGAIASVGGAIVSILIEPLVLKFFPTPPANQTYPSPASGRREPNHSSPIHGRGAGGASKLPHLEGLTYKTDNPWVPRCRAGVFWGTAWGMLIGCLLFPGFAGATAGGAIGGLIGGLAGIISEPLYLYIRMTFFPSSKTSPRGGENEKAARGENYILPSPIHGIGVGGEGDSSLQKEIDKYLEKSPNPWSERCRTGTMVGAAIGALIGYLLFPPLGMFYGSGIGGILGGIIAAVIPSAEKENTKEDVRQGHYLAPEVASFSAARPNPGIAVQLWKSPNPEGVKGATPQNLRDEFKDTP